MTYEHSVSFGEEGAAVSSLLQLGSCPVHASKPSTPKHETAQAQLQTSRNAKNFEGETPSSTPNSTPTRTPVRCFKLAGVKREREDLVKVIYRSDQGDDFTVPFLRGESPATFYDRRDEAARDLLDANRGVAYCSWRKQLVSLLVTDARWVLFRESLQQKRYHYKCVQLVITRYTCTQWRDENPCRNCQNRNWRTGCLKPNYIFHIMPLPTSRNDEESCEECLSDLEASTVERDTSSWTTRMPQINIR